MAPSEKEKMLAGELYRADDPEVVAERRRCQDLLRAYNDQVDEAARSRSLHELLGGVGEGASVQPPLTCDYGYNISLGTRTFVNYGAIILDVAPVVIEGRVQIGTAVQILTADHPRDPVLRRSGVESGSPIRIADNAWIGSGAILCPGVTIGGEQRDRRGERRHPSNPSRCRGGRKPVPRHPVAPAAVNSGRLAIVVAECVRSH